MHLLGLAAILISFCPASAQARGGLDRPGDAPYTPTKLEWAALELQASQGNVTYTSDSPVMVSFIPMPDGKTLLCLLQYPANVQPAVVNLSRVTAQTVFDKYAASRKWRWLQLQFKEQLLGPQ